MIAVYLEDISFKKNAFYIYNEETQRFHLTLNPLFSFSYNEIMNSSEFMLLEMPGSPTPAGEEIIYG